MEIALRNELDKLLTAEQFVKLNGNWIFLNQGGNAPFYSAFRGLGIGFKFRKNRIHVELYMTHSFAENQEYAVTLNRLSSVRTLYGFGVEKDTSNSTHKIFDTIFIKPSDAANFAHALAIHFI